MTKHGVASQAPGPATIHRRRDWLTEPCVNAGLWCRHTFQSRAMCSICVRYIRMRKAQAGGLPLQVMSSNRHIATPTSAHGRKNPCGSDGLRPHQPRLPIATIPLAWVDRGRRDIAPIATVMGAASSGNSVTTPGRHCGYAGVLSLIFGLPALTTTAQNWREPCRAGAAAAHDKETPYRWRHPTPSGRP
jgi:hypothetical protein